MRGQEFGNIRSWDLGNVMGDEMDGGGWCVEESFHLCC